MLSLSCRCSRSGWFSYTVFRLKTPSSTCPTQTSKTLESHHSPACTEKQKKVKICSKVSTARELRKDDIQRKIFKAGRATAKIKFSIPTCRRASGGEHRENSKPSARTKHTAIYVPTLLRF
ncbi:hypothetical protein M011DRAFT_466991 [Sporormia fimetaria CBS 119925]|uniref:Uncharacterized protein n=1 Tax=Sporormia fimetaria CBS 119925 TaxID=1340428 RepID=A0A6A6VFI4_9PLEO|nr:hypothetical protein M011DRAFT_466991 [Sporormia fimetaria CBS 119925]